MGWALGQIYSTRLELPPVKLALNPTRSCWLLPIIFKALDLGMKGFNPVDLNMKNRRQIRLSHQRMSAKERKQSPMLPSLRGAFLMANTARINERAQITLHSVLRFLLCGSSYSINQTKLHISQNSLPYTDSGSGWPWGKCVHVLERNVRWQQLNVMFGRWAAVP